MLNNLIQRWSEAPWNSSARNILYSNDASWMNCAWEMIRSGGHSWHSSTPDVSLTWAGASTSDQSRAEIHTRRRDPAPRIYWRSLYVASWATPESGWSDCTTSPAWFGHYAGRIFVRNVCMIFDTYLRNKIESQEQKSQHGTFSKTIWVK